VSLDRLRAVIEAAPDALVIVDEAYVDFASAGAEAQLDLRRAYPNVAVLRTLSKVGFAALRVGWLVAPAALVSEIDKTRQPYNLPVPSQQGATFVLNELGGEIARMRDVVVAERARLAAGLAALGFNVTPSEANFLWVECARPANEVVSALAARGVLVKSFHASGGRLLKRMRITVGLPGENDRLLHEIASCR
jgi:histidinol-phosphate aminotransferase